MSTPITPLADRVVATRVAAQTKTTSGLYLPEAAKEKPVAAIVQAVGPAVKSVKKGDHIVYKEYATTELTVSGTEYLIVKEEDILAKLT